MKVKTLAILAMSALSLSSASVLAAGTPVTVNGGNVHFKGEVVTAACAIDAGSLDQTVELGQVRTTSLAAAQAVSNTVGFTIQLNDCDTTVSKTAAVAFAGTTIAGNTNVLALQNSSANSAQNVGVQILDSNSTPLALDGTAFGVKTNLSDGRNTIPFQARYYATGAATAGIANADATFKVQYD